MKTFKCTKFCKGNIPSPERQNTNTFSVGKCDFVCEKKTTFMPLLSNEPHLLDYVQALSKSI